MRLHLLSADDLTEIGQVILGSTANCSLPCRPKASREHGAWILHRAFKRTDGIMQVFSEDALPPPADSVRVSFFRVAAQRR